MKLKIVGMINTVQKGTVVYWYTIVSPGLKSGSQGMAEVSAVK